MPTTTFTSCKQPENDHMSSASLVREPASAFGVIRRDTWFNVIKSQSDISSKACFGKIVMNHFARNIIYRAINGGAWEWGWYYTSMFNGNIVLHAFSLLQIFEHPKHCQVVYNSSQWGCLSCRYLPYWLTHSQTSCSVASFSWYIPLVILVYNIPSILIILSLSGGLFMCSHDVQVKSAGSYLSQNYR